MSKREKKKGGGIGFFVEKKVDFSFSSIDLEKRTRKILTSTKK